MPWIVMVRLHGGMEGAMDLAKRGGKMTKENLLGIHKPYFMGVDGDGRTIDAVMKKG